jgi:hypothetical protein
MEVLVSHLKITTAEPGTSRWPSSLGFRRQTAAYILLAEVPQR